MSNPLDNLSVVAQGGLLGRRSGCRAWGEGEPEEVGLLVRPARRDLKEWLMEPAFLVMIAGHLDSDDCVGRG